MSDPTDATPDGTEPTEHGPPEPGPPEPPPGPIGDETARIPEPDVAWNAPQPPRAMPWEAPLAGTPVAAVPPTQGSAPDPTTAEAGSPGAAAPMGVLSAATVGWVAPPPEPVATGQPGWVIAGVGTRLLAWILDGILSLVLIMVGAIVLGVVVAALGMDETALSDPLLLIAVVGFYFVYFVGFWTSGGKATPGMRAFKLQVANADDGKRLQIGQATKRWLALGYVFSLIGLIPILAAFSSVVATIWSIVLLITTAQHTMHQGLHDRWARTVVVRPEGAGAGGGWAVTCLIIVLVLVLVAFISIVALILLGSQVSEILSAVGESI